MGLLLLIVLLLGGLPTWREPGWGLWHQGPAIGGVA